MFAEGGTGDARGRVLPRVNRRTEASDVEFNKELDARGLSCPLPILKTKKALNDLVSGQVLKIVATDPGSVKDMQAFSNQTGHPLLASTEENKAFVFFLRKR
jgi:tRNA 2-thiouridine synthesizing protein A